MIRSTRLLVLAVLPALLFLSACEVTDPLEGVNLVLDVEDAEVDLGAGVVVSVTPGSPSATTQTIPNDFDVASVDEIRQISLPPSSFTFTSSAGKQSGTMATGVIQIYVFLGGVPLPNMPIALTIENNVVTNVSPSTISFLGTTYDVDVAGIETFLNTLPPSQRPDLKAWQNMTIDQVRTELNAALGASSFPIAVGSRVVDSDPNDPLTGSLEIKNLSLSARVRK